MDNDGHAGAIERRRGDSDYLLVAQFGDKGFVAIRKSGCASEPAATVWPISTLRETTVPSTGATDLLCPLQTESRLGPDRICFDQ
jgi:hypothetical protein